jgi:signal transduction histidine kinase
MTLSNETALCASLAHAVRAAGGGTEALRLAEARRAVEALDRGRDPASVRVQVEAAAVAAGLDPHEFLFGVFVRAGSTGLLRPLAPLVAVDVVVRLLSACARLQHASLWSVDEAGGTACRVGYGRIPSGLEAAAAAALAGHAPDAGGPVRCTGVERFGRLAAVLIVSTGGHDAGLDAYLAEAAEELGMLLERDLLLERNADRERAITGSLEKRLTRFAYDLHDGALQELAALGADAALLRKQLLTVVSPDEQARVDGRMDDLQARLASLDQTLRATLASVSGPSGMDSLQRVIAREIAQFSEATGLDIELEAVGSFEGLTDSRRIAIFRIVQEALANVEHHSCARSAVVSIRERRGRVDVSVTDDGRGFDLSPVSDASAQHDRYGLIGMRERIRMLGGDLEITTAPGRGTRVSFSLEPWDPAARVADAVVS